ncbi:NAD(P)-binding domain-containing protein [Alteromonas gracilis]
MSGPDLAVVGYGNVGRALSAALVEGGRRVVIAARPERLEAARAIVRAEPALAAVEVRALPEAMPAAVATVLAVPHAAVHDVLAPLAADLAGHVLIDATNPVGPGLTHAGGGRAGAAVIADLVPAAHVVKAFNVYGAEILRRAPSLEGPRPLMPYAGDDPAAKARVAEVVAGLGWEPLDAGPLAAALDLEHLALLWIRMVRGLGEDHRLVWSARRWSA